MQRCLNLEKKKNYLQALIVQTIFASSYVYKENVFAIFLPFCVQQIKIPIAKATGFHQVVECLEYLGGMTVNHDSLCENRVNSLCARECVCV